MMLRSMMLRSVFAVTIALLLSGCAGWWSETRLIPVAARDSAGLAGVYNSGEDRIVFAPTSEGFVRAADPNGTAPAADVALALLREEPEDPSSDVEVEPEDGEVPQPSLPDRAYLMEFPFTGDDGKTDYTYTIARVSYADDASAIRIQLFGLLCSKASKSFAARTEGQKCYFDDYARLRAAALDALAWYDDARMEIDSATFSLEIEADMIAPVEEP